MKTRLFALVAGALIFTVTGCGQGLGRGYHLNAVFHNVQQLKEGDPVMMAGIEVGRVERIALDPSRPTWQDSITVTMKIKLSVVVRTDCIATIKAATSSGESVIVLEGGSAMAPALADRAFIMHREAPGF